MYCICVFICYYIILYCWHVLIDNEHQVLERHCLTCHNHTSAIEQDTGCQRYINELLLLLKNQVIDSYRNICFNVVCESCRRLAQV